MINAFRKLIWDVSSKTGSFRGKERLVSLISRPRDLNQVSVERDGVSWLLQGHDLNEFVLAVRKNHSTLVSDTLDREIKQKNLKIFWDIGANIGAVSLPLLKRNKDLSAVLFEPSAEVAGRLINNISNNPDVVSRCNIMNIGLASADGLAAFYVSNETTNSGLAGLGFSQNRFQFPIHIQTYAGDTLIAQGKCPIPEIIKIDVEGFEIDVFKGMRETLSKHHPTIIFEHANYRLKERGLAQNEVTGYLESLGYKINRLADDQPVAPADLAVDSDFIARAG